VFFVAPKNLGLNWHRKNLRQILRIIELLTQNIVIKLSKYHNISLGFEIWDPEKIYPGSQIQWSKNPPDPRSAIVLHCLLYKIEDACLLSAPARQSSKNPVPQARTEEKKN
jgi:hypothetical protein